MDHFVITRLGIGISDSGWFERRMKIFERFCFPSVAFQSERSFQWLVVTDICAPQWLEDRFAILQRIFPQLQLLRVDPFERFHLSPVEKSLLKSKSKSEFILTSRIDDDDLWSCRYIEGLREAIESMQLSRRPSLVTMPNGYEIDVDSQTIAEMHYPWIALSANVISPADKFRSCYDFGHTKIAAALKLEGYEALVDDREERFWIYLRHSASDSAFKGVKAHTPRYPFNNDKAIELSKDFRGDLLNLPSGEIRGHASVSNAILDEVQKQAGRRLSTLETKIRLLKLAQARFRENGKQVDERFQSIRNTFYAL